MTLYADNLLLIKPIKDANDYISLQQDITIITNIAPNSKCIITSLVPISRT